MLIEGAKIAAVGRNLKAEAQTIDASNMIVMPGFVDTHHHQYETILRSILADGLLNGPKSYMSDIQGIYTPVYRPEDARISELVASLSQINAGVTTGVDTSQVSHTPEHTDACIDGLREAGRRTLFAYSAGVGPGVKYPQDIRRLRTQYFASKRSAADARDGRRPGREHLGARPGGRRPDRQPRRRQFRRASRRWAEAGLMKADNEYIHCTQLSETAWKLIADTGGHVSIATAIEMQMRHGMPPIQQALDHGITPSLSVDVETNMAADMFTVMRSTFTLQRALLNERVLARRAEPAGAAHVPPGPRDGDDSGRARRHLDRKIGTLTPGKDADIIMLRTDAINVMPLNNAAGAVVTLMDTSNVDTVFIAGKLMKRGGALVGRGSAEDSPDGRGVARSGPHPCRRQGQSIVGVVVRLRTAAARSLRSAAALTFLPTQL